MSWETNGSFRNGQGICDSDFNVKIVMQFVNQRAPLNGYSWSQEPMKTLLSLWMLCLGNVEMGLEWGRDGCGELHCLLLLLSTSPSSCEILSGLGMCVVRASESQDALRGWDSLLLWFSKSALFKYNLLTAGYYYYNDSYDWGNQKLVVQRRIKENELGIPVTLVANAAHAMYSSRPCSLV